MRELKEKIGRISKFPDDIREAYEHTSNHRAEILKSNSVGCFYCCKVFPKSQIVKWLDEDKAGVGQTARCPKCGVDSLIGDAAGYVLNTSFLEKMKSYWF
jgi:ssDNA-binding Zn-finger/Zn-ribbon topoisomerase 1